MQNLPQKFFKTIDLLLENLNSNDRDTVKKNLTVALYASFFEKASVNPENKEFIQSLSSKEISSYEEFEKAVNESKEYFKNSSFDINKALEESMDEVLLDFRKRLKAS